MKRRTGHLNEEFFFKTALFVLILYFIAYCTVLLNHFQPYLKYRLEVSGLSHSESVMVKKNRTK